MNNETLIKFLVIPFTFFKIYLTVFSTLIIEKPLLKTNFLTYNIIKDEKSIGTINIEMITKNEITKYSFESNAKIKILFYNLQIYDKMDVTFKQNNLQEAKLYRTRNERVEVNNTTTWHGNYYSLRNKTGDNGTIKEVIPITTASLYFTEPINVKTVFSEKFQKIIPIRNIGNKKYKMSLPNGNSVIYNYQNGICNLIEAETEFASIKFILNTNNLIVK
ncbi:DUF6134 family protein [Flavobacterium soyangense]|uniref:Uncharacterized protein n=1 Tax=Flavobacterium soyangense TaxID=2023265 RepID=A0A930XV68_9FLAO|nr:DUF6134 family protein [Flavobacterium soyangense]MBF2707986.1 hypothetical protein [Flavobacterium soyangense]